MVPELKIGDRLFIMYLKYRIARAERVALRNQILIQGKAIVEGSNKEARYMLTHSSLNLHYLTTHKTKIQSEHSATAHTIATRVTTFVDVIDLSTIVDADLGWELEIGFDLIIFIF